MNILKLFRREATVEATTEPNEIDAQIQALEAQDALARKTEAERLVREKKAGEEYRAKQKVVSDEFLSRLKPCAETIADLVPRLQWELVQYARLERESYDVPNPGFDKMGIPYGFATKVLDALIEASKGVEWDWAFLSDPSVRSELPRPKAAGMQYAVFKPARDVYGNTQRPGAIDGNTGLPIDGQGTSAMFLPPAV